MLDSYSAFVRVATLGGLRRFVVPCLALLSVSSYLRADEPGLGSFVIYKHADSRDPKLFIEKPAGWKPNAQLPAVVF